MPASVLTPQTAAGVSSDITIAPGATGTVALYTALNDALRLPDVQGGYFLLPDGVSKLLLPDQYGGGFKPNDVFPINIKDPLGSYQPSGMVLRGHEATKTLGPGVWQCEKPATEMAIGFQADTA